MKSVTQIVIETLRTVSPGGMTQSHFDDLISDLERSDPLKIDCCYLCQETECDNDCPFYGYRHPGGNEQWPLPNLETNNPKEIE